MQTQHTQADTPSSCAGEWLARFEQCDVKYLALDPDEDRALIEMLQSRPGWTMDYRDREGVIFVREAHGVLE